MSLLDFTIISSIKSLIEIYKKAIDDKFDEEMNAMVEEFRIKLLIEGFNLLLIIDKLIIIIAFWFIKLFMNHDHPSYTRINYVTLFNMIAISILIELHKRSKLAKELGIIGVIAMFGLLCIHGNLGKETYSIYEFWFLFWSLWELASMFMWLEWRKVVLLRLSIYILFIFCIYYKYEHVPFVINIAIILSSIIFTTSIIIMSQQLKEIIKLIKEKRIWFILFSLFFRFFQKESTSDPLIQNRKK